MSHRITDRITPWVNDSIERHGRGEDIAWEAMLGPNAVQQGAVALILVFWLPGALVNTRMVGTMTVNEDPSVVDEDRLDAAIADFLTEVRETRSQTLSAMRASTPGPAPQQTSPLILPGR